MIDWDKPIECLLEGEWYPAEYRGLVRLEGNPHPGLCGDQIILVVDTGATDDVHVMSEYEAKEGRVRNVKKHFLVCVFINSDTGMSYALAFTSESELEAHLRAYTLNTFLVAKTWIEEGQGVDNA